MDLISLTAVLPLGAAAAKAEGGSFLVSPNVGLMIWTLIATLQAFIFAILTCIYLGSAVSEQH